MAIVATGYVRLEVLSNTLAKNIKKSVNDSLKSVDSDLKKTGSRAGDDVGKGVSESLDKNKDVDRSSERMGQRIQHGVVGGTEDGFQDKFKSMFQRVFRGTNKDVDDEIKKIGSELHASGSRAGDEIGNGITDGVKDSLRRELQSAGTEVDTEIRKIGARGNKASKDAGADIKKGLKEGLSGAAGALAAFAKAAVIFAAPTIASSLGGMAAALVTSIVPAVVYLGSAGAGGLAVAAAGFTSLGIAAFGLKLALGEATPEMTQLKKEFKELKSSVAIPIQKGMLPGLNKGLIDLRNISHDLQPQFKQLGTTLGDAFARITEVISSPANIKRFGRLLDGASRTTLAFGEGLAQLADAALILLDALQPLVDYFAQGFLKFSQWVATTLRAKEANGELKSSIDNLLTRWKQLWETIKDFGKGIFNIFKAASPMAGKFGDGLARIAEKFRAWTDKPANQKRMTDFFQKMSDLAGPLVGLVGDIGKELGHWLENLDTQPIKDAITLIRDTLVPAVVKILKQLGTEAGPKFGETFSNIVGAVKKIADSGIIEKVATGVGNIASALSGLAQTDIGAWVLGIGLALTPLIGVFGPLLTAFKGIRLALFGLKLLSGKGMLSGLFSGLGKDVEEGVGKGAGSGIFKKLTKGFLKGSIITWIAGELLSASSEDFSKMWDDLWDTVFAKGGESLKSIGKAAGDALSVPGNFFTGAVKYMTGDITGAKKDFDAAMTTWDQMKLKFTDPKTWDLSLRAGPPGGDNPSAADRILASAAALNTLNIGKDWDKVATQIRQGVQGATSALNDGGVAINTAANGVIDQLNKANITKFPGLNQFRIGIAQDLQTVVKDFATGDTGIHDAIGNMETNLKHMVEIDPSFAPMADKIRAWMKGMEDEFNKTQALKDARGHLEGFLNSPLIQSGGANDPFSGMKETIRIGLQSLITEIETGGPNIESKAKGLVALLDNIPPGSPLQGWKDNVLQTLKDAGVDITAGFNTAGEKAKAGAGGLGPRMQTGISSSKLQMLEALAGLNTGAVSEVGKLPGLLEQLGLGPEITSVINSAMLDVPPTGTVPFTTMNTNVEGTVSLLPSLILPHLLGVPPVVSTALQPVPGNGTVPFTTMNTNVEGTVSLLPSLILPHLLGTAEQVPTALNPVPTTGNDLFSQLGINLTKTVGLYPGQIQPGLGTTAKQPASQFAGIEQSGLAPWLSMSEAVVGAMNAMNISVARVLVAVAGLVVQSWSIIGQANASGLAGTVSTLNLTIAAARASGLAAQEVANNAIKITTLMIDMARAVVQSQQMLQTVKSNAEQAATAVIQASQAATSAAQAAAAAAASKAAAAATPPVKARYGGTFDPVPGGTLTLIAEAGRSERVEPLDRNGLSARDRAMIDYLAGATGGAGTSSKDGNQVNVHVFIGQRELTDIVDSRIVQANTMLTRSVLSGRRLSAT